MRDEQFLRKARIPMTKREVRAIALSYLELEQARHLLDVGSGTGSVAIEAAKNYPHLTVTGLEQKEEAVVLARENAAALLSQEDDPSRVRFIQTVAPDPSVGLCPDRIFVGGGGRKICAVLDWCAQLLAPGGIVVLDFIALENAAAALAHLKAHPLLQPLQGCQAAISQLDDLAGYSVFKPHSPVYVFYTTRKDTP